MAMRFIDRLPGGASASGEPKNRPVRGPLVSAALAVRGRRCRRDGRGGACIAPPLRPLQVLPHSAAAPCRHNPAVLVWRECRASLTQAGLAQPFAHVLQIRGRGVPLPQLDTGREIRLHPEDARRRIRRVLVTELSLRGCGEHMRPIEVRQPDVCNRLFADDARVARGRGPRLGRLGACGPCIVDILLREAPG